MPFCNPCKIVFSRQFCWQFCKCRAVGPIYAGRQQHDNPSIPRILRSPEAPALHTRFCSAVSASRRLVRGRLIDFAVRPPEDIDRAEDDDRFALSCNRRIDYIFSTPRSDCTSIWTVAPIRQMEDVALAFHSLANGLEIQKICSDEAYWKPRDRCGGLGAPDKAGYIGTAFDQSLDEVCANESGCPRNQGRCRIEGHGGWLVTSSPRQPQTIGLFDNVRAPRSRVQVFG